MNKLLVIVWGTLFLCSLLSCNGQSAKNKKAASSNTTADMIEGKDYLLLKRFRVLDEKGFNQPVEASSFVLPANWQVKSNIQWNGTLKCIPEMLQASIQASSPDGAYELLVYPVTQFDWSNDPIYLDAMKRGFNMQSCTIGTPVDAAGYISNYFAPSLKAQVKKSATIDALQQQMDAGAMQMTNAARSAGNNAYDHKGSAAEGSLVFSDGKEGLAFCTVMQTLVSVPGTQGGMSTSSYCYVSMRVVIKYNAGEETMARNIISTFFSSARINPVWGNAVQQFFANVTKGAQDAQWKQIQISHQAQQEISENIVRSWEARNSSNSSSSSSNENTTEQFGQYLRGVDSWTDESGNKIELTSGYSNAWSKSDGTYLLSNNPAFDPSVTFNEDWKRLNK